MYLAEEGPEQLLKRFGSHADGASRWLSQMAITRQDQDYTFFGTLAPEEMRLELLLDVTGETAPRDTPDHEAVEIILAAAQALQNRGGGGSRPDN